jgi:hypothetical protein
MAKPCRYQLPGEDKWMSESEFKKALNDGLIDKYIGEGTIAIRNFKPKAQSAPVEVPAVEAPIAPVTETKTETPRSLLDESTEIIDSLKDGESFTFPNGSVVTKNGDSFDYQSSEKGMGKSKFSNREEMIFFTNNQLSKSRVGKNIELKNYDTETVTGDKLKVGDVYVRDISGTRYVFKLLENPTRDRRGNFYNAKVEVLSIGNQPTEYRSATPSSKLGKVFELERAVGKTTFDSFKSITKDSSTFGNVKKIKNWKSTTEAPTETETTAPVTEAKTEAPKAESNTEKITRGADMLKNMSEEERDNFTDDWFNDRIPRESLPGGSDAIKLYEARIVAPKPMNKPKRLTMDNAFELSNEHGFIINIDGELYGLSKVEDPDSTSEAEDKFGDPKEYVWVHSKISEGIDGKTTETYTSDINEVIDDIKSSKSTKAESKTETKAEPTQVQEPEAEYQKEEPTEQPKTREDYIAIAKESNGDYAVVEGRTGYQFVFKKNRRTGRWQGLTGSGEFVDANDEMNRKANDAVNYTRKDRKIVRMKTVKNGITSTDEFVYDYNTNEWKKRSEDGFLYGIGPELAARAEQEFLKENPKRAAKRAKVEKFFDDLKAGIDENIIMSTLPFLTPKNRKRLIDAAKALVLAGMDLTTAINQAAHSVLNALVREKEITQQEADEALIEVYKGDFLLRPELSGIKNELASENAQEVARKGIDKMNVKEALDAGARAIQDGEVNPESIIGTFVEGIGRVLTPIETAAMIRYKAGLDNEISDQYIKLASIENKRSTEAKQVRAEIKRLEKKVEDYEIMQVTSGYYQSLSFSLRQFMLTSEYNITKLKSEIAAGYDGKIPEDILARINEASAKLTQLNKDIAKLEREKAKLEDSETIESVKNEKTKSSKGKAITSSDGRISISTDKIKEAISKGADTIEDVIEYVREDVKKQYPDVTDREIRDAISNYGKVSSDNKSDLQKKIEEIRLIGKKISLLEDINAEIKKRESKEVKGFFAKKRAENKQKVLNDRRSELERQIKEAMSKMPLTEEEIALKEEKRLEAFKKRTETRIKELQRRIADGDFSTKPRPKSLELDEEAKKLNAEREKIFFQFEEEKAKAKYNQRSEYEVAFDALISMLNLSKSLIASLDLSVSFTQGFVYTMSQDPRKTGRQLQKMIELTNEENYNDWLVQLKASDEYNLIKASKLFIVEPSAELTAREESFMSNLGKYVPILGKSVKTKSGKEIKIGVDLYGKSERAYSGFLNVLRVQAFMEGATTLQEEGYTMDKNPEVFRAMADFVNNATGRGTGGRTFENAASKLSLVFFSPRLIKSRLNLLNPVYYLKMPASVRAIALKRMSKLMATSTLLVSLAAIMAAGNGGDDEDDVTVELDPRSSDFAKIRMGNTRIDFLGGFQPYFKAFMQGVYYGEKKNTETKEIEKLGSKYGGATRGSVLEGLFINKFSPVGRAANDMLFKYDYQKEADEAREGKYSAFTDLAVPIYLQDIDQLIEEQGYNTLWLAPLSMIGINVQNYGKTLKDSNMYDNDFDIQKELEKSFKDIDSEFETSDPFKN